MDKNGQPLPQEPLSSTFIDQLDEPFWSMIARECIPLVTSSVANTSNEQEQQQHQHQQRQAEKNKPARRQQHDRDFGDLDAPDQHGFFVFVRDLSRQGREQKKRQNK